MVALTPQCRTEARNIAMHVGINAVTQKYLLLLDRLYWNFCICLLKVVLMLT